MRMMISLKYSFLSIPPMTRIADHGESIQVGFGTDLPPGVSCGLQCGATATVTIIDDDPAVTVKFDSTTYSVTEGNDRWT